MKSYSLIILFLMIHKIFSFKANHQIERQTKSIFSNKPCKELFTPARYVLGMKKINYEQPVGINNVIQNFPDVEYPTNILEASKPYFYKMSDGMLGPFPEDVKSSYKTLVENNMKAFDELKTKHEKICNDDFRFNAKSCPQENTENWQPEETLDIEPKTKSESETETETETETEAETETETETEPNDVEQNEISNTDTEEDIKSDDSTSESDETVEDIEQNAEIMRLENDEKILSEDCYQSCESLQYYSDEIKEQLLEAEHINGEEPEEPMMLNLKTNSEES